MSEAERRAARAGEVFTYNGVRLVGRRGPEVECYVCGAMHTASAVVILERKGKSTEFMLCEPCFANRQDDVLRKFLPIPDLRFIEGRDITTEQFLAMAEKQHATVH